MPKKTLDHKPRSGEMLKPKELIELKGAGPLTLTDRRMFNTLVQKAWGPRLGEPGVWFSIETVELKEQTKRGERITDSLERLMRTICVIRTPDGSETRTPLLSSNKVHLSANSGSVEYQFTPTLADILQTSLIFAKLDLQVAKSFHSKYGFSLYEAISRRIRLKSSSEVLTIEELRELLGVDDGKLIPFKNLNTYAIRPALKEINETSPYVVNIEPRKEGRKVVALVMSWKVKTAAQYADIQNRLE